MAITKLIEVMKALDISGLETPRDTVTFECTVLDLKTLAAAYGIHFLMFGPLLIPEAPDQGCHLQPRSGFEGTSQWANSRVLFIKQSPLARLLKLFRTRMHKSQKLVQDHLCHFLESPGQIELSQHFGKNAEYASPVARLPGTEDIALVHLTLHPNGESDIHQHPGDEMMLVIGGRIQVNLPEIGISTELNAGDFIHFYAEQIHGAKCVGEQVATVLVIRFLQLQELGVRYSLHSDVTSSTNWDNADFVNRVKQEFQQVLMPFNLIDRNAQTDQEREVVDRYGLARLLHSAQKSNDFEMKELVKRARERGLGSTFNSAKFNHISRATTRILESHLPPLADIYGTYPAVLYDYLHPVHTPVIQVCNPELPNAENSWDRVPQAFVKASRVTYSVPKRRLAHSDMSVSYLWMEPRSSTDQNSHPGFELLIPLFGAVTIERLNRDPRDLNHEMHMYAHFGSNDVHQVINKSDTPAKLIVVRFYRN